MEVNWTQSAARFLLRVHPRVRPRQLDGHIRKENSRRLGVRRSAMVRREEQRASLLVACPGGCDVSRWFGYAAMINELYDSPIRPDVKIPSVSRRVATNLRRIFHRDKLRRTLSDRQFLVVLLHYVRASVPVKMEREDRPIIVVDEGRFNFIFQVGRHAVELRAEIGNLDRLAVLVFSFVGDFSGLGLPLPGMREIQLQGWELQVERIADRFNLPIRIKAIGFGELFDNGRARLCPGSRSKDQHPESQKTDHR